MGWFKSWRERARKLNREHLCELEKLNRAWQREYIKLQNQLSAYIAFVENEFPLLPVQYESGKIHLKCKEIEIESNGLTDGTILKINKNRVSKIRGLSFGINVGEVGKINIQFVGVPDGNEYDFDYERIVALAEKVNTHTVEIGESYAI